MADEPSLSKRDIIIWYIFAAIGGVLLMQWVFASYSQVETIPFSRFDQLVIENKVAEVMVGQDTIQGTLKEPLPSGKKEFVTTRVNAELADKLAAHGVSVTGVPSGGFLLTLLSWIVPALAFYLIWVFMIRGLAERQGFGGLMSIGKSHAKIYVETDTKVTFADVAGIEEAKFELREVVSFLKDQQSYGRLGARVPKGILLVGPPGTGKTLLARAVAGEAGVPFFSISGSEFVEMFVGVGAARVRDLFEQARKAAPCIIFIDELDALGRSRTVGGFGGYDEKEQTLNQLLAELDGFDPSVGVILLAATNRPEVLDPALLRAGRFDRQVLVDRPDRTGRLAILQVHIRKIRLDKDVDLDKVAGLTPGFTGADLANLINEAAIAATRRNADAVTSDDFNAAIERIVAGIEKKSRVLSVEERRRVAFHEMGHALVAASLPGIDPVHKVSIIPRGVGALGYTMQRPTEDRFLLAESDLEKRITVLMGGRAAEQLIFDGDVSTGAADDLQRATEIAVEMVTKYGMDAAVGQRTYAPRPQLFLTPVQDQIVSASEATAREIDLAVRDLVEAAGTQAREIIERRRHDLEAGVALLIQKETLTAEEFEPLRQAAPSKPKPVVQAIH
ncbi:ATP-dependent zinc metalloprotease FtsH [Beijerinckia indica]|uniref:ATP-dependent zinc metalloprotease FtsH n=1 Tax=Beijerinckia indica subsp. indica (strain ATCC 9039 / DSM 1715 / NCIMB 8712) TaxID=395963 RepID=B2IJJ9_BEII9|nr:ATP-dependent zinc metalloprotease FtsH [Beijerinckia indica]ACB94873.1 ATP-dependent metalloprotease FtsH [Beijerinckia indica subsp. indica ATCC 9039]